MPDKDHVTTTFSNAKKENKEVRNLATTLFISNNPPESEIITGTSIDILSAAIDNVLLPIQSPVDDTGTSVGATTNILLDKVNSGLHVIRLPTLDEIAINFQNLVTNTFQTFFLDLTKVNNDMTPTVTFNPPINGLTQDDIDNNDRLCVQVLAHKTETGTSLDVIGGVSGGGEFVGPWTADHNAGGFKLINSGGIGFTGTDLKAITPTVDSINYDVGSGSSAAHLFRYVDADDGSTLIATISQTSGLDMHSNGIINAGAMTGVSSIGFSNDYTLTTNSNSINLKLGDVTDTFSIQYDNSDDVLTTIASFSQSIGLNLHNFFIGNVNGITMGGTAAQISNVNSIEFSHEQLIFSENDGDLLFRVDTAIDQYHFNYGTTGTGTNLMTLSGGGLTLNDIGIAGVSAISGLTSITFAAGSDTYSGAIRATETDGIIAVVPAAHAFSINVGAFSSTTTLASFSSAIGLNLHNNFIANVNGIAMGGTSSHITNAASISFTNNQLIGEQNNGDVLFRVDSVTDQYLFNYGTTGVGTNLMTLSGGGLTLSNNGIAKIGAMSGLTSMTFAIGTETYSGTIRATAAGGIIAVVPTAHSFSINEGVFASTSTLASFSSALGLSMHGNPISSVNSIFLSGTTSEIHDVNILRFTNSHDIISAPTNLAVHIDGSTDKFSINYQNSNSVDIEIAFFNSSGLDLKGLTLSNAQLGAISHLDFTNGHYIDSDPTELHLVVDGSTDKISFGYEVQENVISAIADFSSTNGLDMIANGIIRAGAISGVSGVTFTGTAGKSITSSGTVDLIMAVPSTGDMSFRVGSTDYIKLDSSDTEIEIHQKIIMAGNSASSAITSLNNLGFIDGHFIRGFATSLQFDLGASTDRFSFVYGSSNTEILHIDSDGLDLGGNTLSNFLLGDVPKLDFTNNHYIDSDPNELHIVVDGSTDKIAFGYSPTDTSILGIASFSGTSGLDMISNGIINVGAISGTSRITFSNDQYIISETTSLNLHVDNSSEKVVFEYGNSQTVFADISATNGLDMKSNDIRNIGIASGLTSLNFGAGKTINSSGSDLIITTPTSGDLIFREGFTEFFRLDGGNNDIRFNRDITMVGLTEINFVGGLGMSGNIDMNSNDITEIDTLGFGANDREIKITGNNITYQVPSGADHIFEEGNFEFLRMNGGTNNIEFERNIVLNNGRSVRSDSASEIGFFVTNSTSATGTQGTIQIPTSTVQGVTTASLNLLFGSAIGCIGFVGQGQSTTSLAIKNTSNSWVLITLPSSGVVTTAST